MVMISIIGDDISQLLPIIYAYKNNIDKYILLCDDTRCIRVNTLKKSLHQFIKDYQLSWLVEIQVIDEYNINDVMQNIEGLLLAPKECLLNICETHPLWTLKFSKLFHDANAQIIHYEHFTNRLHFINNTYNTTSQILKPTISIDSYISLLGYNIVQKQTTQTLQHRKKHILTLYKNPSRFKKLRLALLQEDRHFNYKPYEDLLHTLGELGIVKNHRLIPSQQKALSGDVFEEYVFWLCEALNPDDIALGVKIDFDDMKNIANANYHIYNEFDILIMHQNRLFTVECKYSKRLEGLEFVYKYDAIIDYFGKASKAIILNISSKPKEPYLEMNSSSNFRHSTLRRARLSGIHIYHEAQVDTDKFQLLVRQFFHIGGNDEQTR